MTSECALVLRNEYWACKVSLFLGLKLWAVRDISSGIHKNGHLIRGPLVFTNSKHQ